MHMGRQFIASFTLAAIVLTAPMIAFAQSATPVNSPGATPEMSDIGDVRVIGVQVLEKGLIVGDTLVGGFSGLDYDAGNNVWYVVSDDRSMNDPARFYTATLDYSPESFEHVSIDSAITLLQENGEPYPNREQGGNVPDTEAIRFDRQTELIWYTSEGDEELGIDPFVAAATTDGTWMQQPALPDIFDVDQARTIGTRNNNGFEGLSLSADRESLWLGLEESLYQDGDLSTTEQGGLPRFTNIDRDGNVLGSYVYELDALSNVPEGGDGSNGAAEILAVDAATFLVVERMSIMDADGVYTNYIKIYEADISGATDVSTMDAIRGEAVTPVSKRRVLDLNVAGVDPIDNFNPDEQVTEFIALEVLD